MIDFPIAATHHAILSASVVTSLFALAGYRLRGVSRSGAVAGFAVAFALYVSAGAGAFAVLAALFAVTFAATRLGRQQKLHLGTAERPEGRDATQVLANVGIAALFAASYKAFGHPALLAGCAAALAEAAADTVSSECGQAFGSHARLLTTGTRVPAGTNGGVSLAGTACGAVAALGMALVAAWAGLVGWGGLGPGIVVLAALAGVFLDSLLGATLEGPGWLNNNAVNLAGTALAAILAAFLAGW